MAEGDPVRAEGHCLCGSVGFAVSGPMRRVVECHCTECRRFTGGLWHATATRREHLNIEDGGGLKWFQFSPSARRGFCGHCGSSLFFDPMQRSYIAIAAGSLEATPDLDLSVRIFCKEKGDYYEIVGDVPSHPKGSPDLKAPEA